MAISLPYTESFFQRANAKVDRRAEHRATPFNGTGANLYRIRSESYSEPRHLVIRKLDPLR